MMPKQAAHYKVLGLRTRFNSLTPFWRGLNFEQFFFL
jgi:hypothetical protein